MEMSGERRIEAPQEAVWRALNDPEVLKAAIPGCDSLERVSDTAFAAKVTTKLGPIKATFSGQVSLSDIVPPRGYRIAGEGQGGVAGFARGGATVALAPDGDATILRYSVDAAVGGKIAQLGARLIDTTARKLADQFFARFAAIVSGPDAGAPRQVA
ncbi:CoxG family protein [Methylobacterium sp. ID0610]|uniref:CoxG family protein n=1 Tax=Methylobacterium carpenticola TaxID=3344827 RepID=UPI0036B71F5D